MKKTIIKSLFAMLFLTMLGGNAKSQALIGYSPSEVRAEFPDANWEYDKWGENKQWLIMRYKNDSFGVIYFFDEKNISIYTTIKPLTQGAMQWLVEKYNNRYVIIDNKTWKFYNNDSIMLCQLKTTDDGNYFFSWSVVE